MKTHLHNRFSQGVGARKATIVLLPMVLGACGGGGGNNTNVSPATPALTSNLVTSVAAPQYQGSYAAVEVALFNTLNTLRQQMSGQTGGGVGLLAQDPALDTAAQAHADYLKRNQTESHSEDPTAPGYYGASPLERARKAGLVGNAWVGEVVGDPGKCLSQLMATVYHQQLLTSNAERIGMGFNDTVCVLEFASLSGVTAANAPGAADTNAIPVWGGQQMPASLLAYTPVNGSMVSSQLSANEQPRPAPELASPGYPIMVRVRADNNDVLSVSSFTVSNGSGPIAGDILIPVNAEGSSVQPSPQRPVLTDAHLAPGVVFFIPQVPLVTGTSYSVVFNGSRNGKPVQVAWSFTVQHS